MNFNTTEELIQELRAGRMIVLADDEARENEGDLVVAASLVTPEHINFMTRHGRGLLCLAMTRKRCQQLNLPSDGPDHGRGASNQFHVYHRRARGHYHGCVGT